jgi:ketosteroid isomerase-like protein
MTAEEERNLELAKKYHELYNTDIDRFVPECYAPDFEVVGPGIASFSGYDTFIRVEKEILKRRPERKMRVVEFFPSGDTVVVEGVGFVAFLKCKDGKIIQDRTHPTLNKEEYKRRNPEWKEPLLGQAGYQPSN